MDLLLHNFRLFFGIGQNIEFKLKQIGIKNWDDIMLSLKPQFINQKIWDKMKSKVIKVKTALKNHNFERLNTLIPKKFHWQLIPHFINKIAYLDIETTGLSWYTNHITTIAVYDGNNIYNFVRGQNLDEFPDFIKGYPAVATFYGKGFDVPFIQNEMNIDMFQIHFDLCFLLRKIGLRGGLKSIEKQLSISRPESEGIDGYFAVILWKKYMQTKDSRYLDTLLAYNNEDVINLEYLLFYFFNTFITQNKVENCLLEFKPTSIQNPYHACKEILRQY